MSEVTLYSCWQASLSEMFWTAKGKDRVLDGPASEGKGLQW